MLGELVVAAVVLLILLVLVAAYLRLKTEKAYLELVGELVSRAGSEEGEREERHGGSAPPPVERYLEKALPDDRAGARTAFLEQRGWLRVGEDRDSEWREFTADQIATVDPPGFVWRAEVKMAPLVSASVVDAYVAGEGSLQAKLMGVVPVADAPSGPELDSAELVRYLAEAVWYPSALRPGGGVEWEEIDGDSAKGRLRDGETEAALTFHFRDDGLLERVSGERYREVDGGYEKTGWTGHFRNYREIEGVLIPTEGEVAWKLPQGETTYWRGEVTDVEYGEE